VLTETQDPIRRATSDVRAELTRVDAKAATLLTLAGTALTVALAVLARAHLPGPAAACGWLTAAVIATAVTCLATAVRPALAGNHGFVHYAQTPAERLRVELTADAWTQVCDNQARDAEALVWLSQAAVRKYRRVRLAVDLLLAGLAGTALTAALAAAL
jgi:hypothetical protein